MLAYGFPTGGTSLSITRGIVSRIEFVGYGLSTSGLRIQIDAAINPGNSGGPAIAAGKMLGLAFSHLVGSENISYIIPNEEIELFLQDIADGHYDGKPGMYDVLQTLENPSLRGFLKLDASVRGTIVNRPDDGVPGNPLQAWDVITRIGDTEIDDEGMVKAGPNLRVAFEYEIQKIARNGSVPLTVVRGGKSQQLQMPVPARRPLLIDGLRGEYPSYFIYGPLVFSRATLESLMLLRQRPDAMPSSPLIANLGDPPGPQREELVVISSPLFPHALSKGYSNPAGEVVKAVNGTAVKSLAHLVALLRDLKDEYVVIDFENRQSEGLVFPRAKLTAATEEILTDNGVRSQGSPTCCRCGSRRGSPRARPALLAPQEQHRPEIAGVVGEAQAAAAHALALRHEQHPVHVVGTHLHPRLAAAQAARQLLAAGARTGAAPAAAAAAPRSCGRTSPARR